MWSYPYWSNEQVVCGHFYTSFYSHSLAGLGRRIVSILLCPCYSCLGEEHSCTSLFDNPWECKWLSTTGAILLSVTVLALLGRWRIVVPRAILLTLTVSTLLGGRWSIFVSAQYSHCDCAGITRQVSKYIWALISTSHFDCIRLTRRCRGIFLADQYFSFLTCLFHSIGARVNYLLRSGTSRCDCARRNWELARNWFILCLGGAVTGHLWEWSWRLEGQGSKYFVNLCMAL